MAAVNRYQIDPPPPKGFQSRQGVLEVVVGRYQQAPEFGNSKHYKMRWYDVDVPNTVIYRVWVVVGAPDPTGAQYTGPKGGATPITNAVTADVW